MAKEAGSRNNASKASQASRTSQSSQDKVARYNRDQDLMRPFDSWWDRDFWRGRDLFPSFFNHTPETFNQLPSMHIDIVEKDSNYQITCDVPGVDKKDIKITLRGNVMEITGERKESRDESNPDHTVHRKERYYGNFVRRFTLPEDTARDLSSIKAKCDSGVLTICVPKSDSASRAYNIDVE